MIRATLSFLFVFFIAAFFPVASFATPCRFYFANQSDWGAKIGFYLDLENDAADGSRCALNTLVVAFGVADGQNWRFIIQHQPWQLNHDYILQAVLSPTKSQLTLDGISLGEIAGAFTPDYDAAVLAADLPGWAAGPADYMVIQTGLALSSSGGQTASVPLDAESQRPLPLMLLAPGVFSSTPWSPPVAETITVTATFHMVAAPDPLQFAPYIDRYGQSRYGDWAGKIKLDSDLASAAVFERQKLGDWGVPSGYDAYGGVTFAGWSERATGFFRVTKHDGRWWLITPDGNPCFYIGVSTAPALNWDRTPITGRTWLFDELPPRTDPWTIAWGLNSWGQNDGTEDVSFNTVNMIRKYGDAWQATATDALVQRVRAWAFSGLGKWSTDAGHLPIIPVLYTNDVPLLVRHPDIFDPAIQQWFHNSLAWWIDQRKDDPLVVGWSFHNEYDEIITPDEVTGMLAKGSAVPAKRALVDYALANIYGGNAGAMAASWGVRATTVSGLYGATPAPPSADVETLRQYFAREYYAFLYRTIKSIDPNHLYFGFWIVPGWWVNEDDWRLIAPYTDVIGYDYYGYQFTDARLARLFAESDKPVFLGEFSFPATYRMQRGFGSYGVHSADDASSGAMYRQWLADARANPYCVGVSWFQYRDEPVSGRGPGQGTNLVYGENFAFGLVDVGDRPKYDLVEHMRAANLQAPLGRLAPADHPYAPPAPAIAAGGAGNAASGGAVVAGSIVRIAGDSLASRSEAIRAVPLGTFAAGVRATMNGVAMPAYFVSQSAMYAQVPWELEGQTSATLAIEADGVMGESRQVALAPVAPAIFTTDYPGAGQGAVRNAPDGTLAAPGGNGRRPARRGESILIACTALGPVDNRPATGAAPVNASSSATKQPVQVTIGGVSVSADYAALAPGVVGIYQVSVRMPSEAPSGSAVPLTIAIGSATSNSVTIAVE